MAISDELEARLVRYLVGVNDGRNRGDVEKLSHRSRRFLSRHRVE
jgi:hypothetical protein